MDFSLRYQSVAPLVPGPGFSGATAQPPQVGSGQGADENAICGWDVVPYQTFAGLFFAGVVAFHVNGINRVEFSANGAAWKRATTMLYNAQTGVVEYVALLNAADFTDGLQEIRAVAYPNDGVPVVLPSMWLNTNAGGTLTSSTVRYVSPTGNDANNGLTSGSPKATIVGAANSIGMCDGATIYLLAGTHTYGQVSPTCSTTSRWLTIKPAPGLTVDDVTIGGTTPSDSPGLNMKLVKFESITFTGSITGGGVVTDYVWWDRCKGSGASAFMGAANGVDIAYVTDCSFSDVSVPMVGCTLIRNTTVDTVDGDIMTGSTCMINVRVSNFLQTGLSHSNFYQSLGPLQNVVLYGCVLEDFNAQIFQYNDTPTDHAIVDCTLNTSQYALVFGATMRNYYVSNCTINGGVVDAGNIVSLTNVVVGGCTINGDVFGDPGFPTTPAGVTYRAVA